MERKKWYLKEKKVGIKTFFGFEIHPPPLFSNRGNDPDSTVFYYDFQMDKETNAQIDFCS